MPSASVLLGKPGPASRGSLLEGAAPAVVAPGIPSFRQGPRHFLAILGLVA